VSVNGSTAACQGNPLKPNWYVPCGEKNDRVMPHTGRPIHFHSNVTYITFSNGVGVKSYYKPLGAAWPAKHTINIADLDFGEAGVSSTESAKNVTIYKVDYPVQGSCGQEVNVLNSNFNPHYFFPIHFGGFAVGSCSTIGYNNFVRNQTVAMNPVPGVHHNLTFQIWSKDLSAASCTATGRACSFDRDCHLVPACDKWKCFTDVGECGTSPNHCSGHCETDADCNQATGCSSWHCSPFEGNCVHA